MNKYLTNFNDTIISLATPFGKGGIGIIRISGKLSSYISKKFFKILPKTRYATFSTFINPKNNEKLDNGILIFFKGPNSFTGEDILEFQGHGSPIMLSYLIKIIIFETKIRLSYPGEFSSRALINGKLSLEQSEGILNLIDSKSILSAKLSVNSINNFFSKKINNILKKLNDLNIFIETSINFSNYETDEILDNKINIIKNELIEEFKKIIDNFNINNVIKKGIKVVLIGDTNVGKSTIFNCLINKNKSIISNIKGTTRDLINYDLWIKGICFNITDTAGIRKTNNKIEILGIKKTIEKINKSNCILYITDKKFNIDKITLIIYKLFNKYNININILKKNNLAIIKNKCDIYNEEIRHIKNGNKEIIYVSAKKNKGIDLIKLYFESLLKNNIENDNYLVSYKQIEVIKDSLFILNNCNISDLLLFSHNVKYIIKILSKILNIKIKYNDKILDKIFSKFCIGK